MKKLRVIALLLAAILTISCVAPTVAYATETTDTTEATEGTTEPEAIVRAPYKLHSELVDQYDANVVRVWLELDPARAESVTSYQITLQLLNGKGSTVAGRQMSLAFDETVEAKAKVKEAIFNAEMQSMQIYVAATENLVQIATDEKGNLTNVLPIGVFTVEKRDGVENMFEIEISGNTGDLATVNTSMEEVNAAETYGVDFVIPVDGVVYGQPVLFPLGIKIEGKGTVEATAVNASEATDEENKFYEGSRVRLRATPAQGYRLAELTLIDELHKEHVVELEGDFTFTMSSVIGVKAKFVAVEETHTVTVVGENASILGTTAKEANFKVRAVATVQAKVPAGMQFSCWQNEQQVAVSYKATYSFAVTSNITLTPVFINKSETKTEEPTVILNTTGKVVPFGAKYRVSYSGVCTVPTGYKLVKRGILLTNQIIDGTNLDQFVMGGTVNGVKVATCAVSGTNAQFIANINNVAGGQSRTARAFLTYEDNNKNQVTIYSTNVVEVGTP